MVSFQAPLKIPSFAQDSQICFKYLGEGGPRIQVGAATQSIEVKTERRVVQQRRTVERESRAGNATEDSTISIADERAQAEVAGQKRMFVWVGK